MIDVAIVGAGPAGANCAYTLAKKGVHAVLFDSSHPREKPCGGLLGMAAEEAFPIIGKLSMPFSEIAAMKVVSPRGVTWHIKLKHHFMAVSRLKFDQYLLDRALNEGAELVKEKVTHLEQSGEAWKISTGKQDYEAKVVVGADGVHSLVRKATGGQLPCEDLGGCFGFTVKGVVDECATLKFSSKNSGYLWVFPRGDHTSIGGGTRRLDLFRGLKGEVESFANVCCPGMEKASVWAALIPNFKDSKGFLVPTSGSNWVLVGDAAGHVSPVSGSGIEYALADGELAAQVILEGKIERYSRDWLEMYGQGLANQVRTANLIYRGPLLEFYCMFAKMRTLVP